MYNFSLLPSVSLSYSPISPSLLQNSRRAAKMNWATSAKPSQSLPAIYQYKWVQSVWVCVWGAGGGGVEVEVSCWPSVNPGPKSWRWNHYKIALLFSTCIYVLYLMWHCLLPNDNFRVLALVISSHCFCIKTYCIAGNFGRCKFSY